LIYWLLAVRIVVVVNSKAIKFDRCTERELKEKHAFATLQLGSESESATGQTKARNPVPRRPVPRPSVIVF
jgi:hypothetical protein